MLGEPEAVEQHGMAKVTYGLVNRTIWARARVRDSLEMATSAPPFATSSTTSLKALRTAVEARLDAEPDAMSRASVAIEAGELAVRSDIVERWLVSLGHGNDQFAAVDDSLDIWSPQIGSHSSTAQTTGVGSGSGSVSARRTPLQHKE